LYIKKKGINMNNCADIKVGYACNNKCIHCVIANQKIAAQKKYSYINRTTKECLQIIQDSKDNGYNDIVITGGEPTIRKDFFEILEFAKSLGMSIYLQTNGRMFMNEEFAKKSGRIHRTLFNSNTRFNS
ncbi:MAG: radical SAM protein, partial [Lachnospiraceae bacterium]|nr:radical SAM protein [Lachnospiraceae bacterium]